MFDKYIFIGDLFLLPVLSLPSATEPKKKIEIKKYPGQKTTRQTRWGCRFGVVAVVDDGDAVVAAAVGQYCLAFR